MKFNNYTQEQASTIIEARTEDEINKVLDLIHDTWIGSNPVSAYIENYIKENMGDEYEEHERSVRRLKINEGWTSREIQLMAAYDHYKVEAMQNILCTALENNPANEELEDGTWESTEIYCAYESYEDNPTDDATAYLAQLI